MLMKPFEAVVKSRDSITLNDRVWADIDRYRQFYAEETGSPVPTRSQVIERLMEYCVVADKDYQRWSKSQPNSSQPGKPSSVDSATRGNRDLTPSLPSFDQEPLL